MEQVLVSSPTGRSGWKLEQNPPLGFLLLDPEKGGTLPQGDTGSREPDLDFCKAEKELVSLSLDKIFQENALRLDDLFRGSGYPWDKGPVCSVLQWEAPPASSRDCPRCIASESLSICNGPEGIPDPGSAQGSACPLDSSRDDFSAGDHDSMWPVHFHSGSEELINFSDAQSSLQGWAGTPVSSREDLSLLETVQGLECASICSSAYPHDGASPLHVSTEANAQSTNTEASTWGMSAEAGAQDIHTEASDQGTGTEASQEGISIVASQQGVGAEAMSQDIIAEASLQDMSTEVSLLDVSAEASLLDVSAEASLQDVSTEASLQDKSAEVTLQVMSAEARQQCSNPEDGPQDISIVASLQDLSLLDVSAEARQHSISTETNLQDMSAEAGQQDMNAEASLQDMSGEVRPQDMSTDTRQQPISTETSLQDINIAASLQDICAEISLQDMSAEASLLDTCTQVGLQDMSADTRQQRISTVASPRDINIATSLQNMSAEVSLRDINIAASLQNMSTEVGLKDMSEEGSLLDVSTEASLLDMSAKASPQDISIAASLQDVSAEVSLLDMIAEVRLQDMCAEAGPQDMSIVASLKDMSAEASLLDMSAEASPLDISIVSSLQDVSAEVSLQDMSAEASLLDMSADAGPQDISIAASQQDVSAEVSLLDMIAEVRLQDMCTEAGPQDMSIVASLKDMSAEASLLDMSAEASPLDISIVSSLQDMSAEASLLDMSVDAGLLHISMDLDLRTGPTLLSQVLRGSLSLSSRGGESLSPETEDKALFSELADDLLTLYSRLQECSAGAAERDQANSSSLPITAREQEGSMRFGISAVCCGNRDRCDQSPSLEYSDNVLSSPPRSAEIPETSGSGTGSGGLSPGRIEGPAPLPQSLQAQVYGGVPVGDALPPRPGDPDTGFGSHPDPLTEDGSAAGLDGSVGGKRERKLIPGQPSTAESVCDGKALLPPDGMLCTPGSGPERHVGNGELRFDRELSKNALYQEHWGPGSERTSEQMLAEPSAPEDGVCVALAVGGHEPQTEDDLSPLRAVFSALDQDRDGFVQIEEFLQFAKAYGAEQVKDLTRFLDPSGLGVISFEDFHRGIGAIGNGAPSGADPQLSDVGLPPQEEAPGCPEEYDDYGTFENEVTDSAYLGSESTYSEYETLIDEDAGVPPRTELHEEVETDSAIEEGGRRLSLGSELNSVSLVTVVEPGEEHFEDFGEGADSELLQDGPPQSEGNGSPAHLPQQPSLLLSPSGNPFPASFQSFLREEIQDFFCSQCHKQISRLEDLSTRLHFLEMNSTSKRLSSRKTARHLLQGGALSLGPADELARDILDLADTDLIDKVMYLEKRVSELEQDSADSTEQHTRLRQENLQLVHRANALEEQLKEQEALAEEDLQFEVHRQKEALGKLERERGMELENLQTRLQQLDEENCELRSCVTCLHAHIERLEEEKRKLQDETENLTDRLNEELEVQRKVSGKLSHERHKSQKEKEHTQELIEDLRKQLELLQLFRLEVEARSGQSPRAGLQEYQTRTREAELEQEVRRLKQDNRGLKEQNDELNGQIITLSIQGAKNLFAASFSESLAAEINSVSRDELMEAIHKQEEINYRLQDYIDRIIVAIMESNPSILEVK